MNRFVISCISLLLTLCVTLLAGFAAYHASHSYEYADLTFDAFSIDGNRLPFQVSSKTDGEYVYRVLTASVDEDGKLSVTVRGGRQASLAQTPGEMTAFFHIDLPEGTKKVVCGKSTIYSVS